MTETLVAVTPSENARNKAAEAATEVPAGREVDELEVARELVRQARDVGVALTGPDGLLKAITKTVIETALDEELLEHLGYHKHDREGHGNGNSRNGTAPRAATFYLLVESFDDDPFAILAWRGREREELLANLAAARTEGPPAADRAEQAARPLVECLDTYYAWQADIRVPSPPATPSTALLDQLPDTSVAARGRPLTELLRPAYHTLGRGGQAELA